MYLNAKTVKERGLIGKVKASLNGQEVGFVIAAKHGKNGFVEFVKYPIKVVGDSIKTTKMRGNVKISFNLN